MPLSQRRVRKLDKLISNEMKNKLWNLWTTFIWFICFRLIAVSLYRRNFSISELNIYSFIYLYSSSQNMDNKIRENKNNNGLIKATTVHKLLHMFYFNSLDMLQILEISTMKSSFYLFFAISLITNVWLLISSNDLITFSLFRSHKLWKFVNVVRLLKLEILLSLTKRPL